MAGNAAFTVRQADYRLDFPHLRAVRGPVFVIEQQVPLALELDALDADCQHVLAFDGQNRPIGTGRLTPQHTIGRMAVLPDWRGRGVGDALLLALIALAKAKHWPEVSLHAQLSAMEFYRKHGFNAFGPVYEEAGILHQSMSLPLKLYGN
jgi:predicted GNAT family N-acyltransferase